MASRGQRRASFPQLGPDPEFRHMQNKAGESKYTPAGNPKVGLSFSVRGIDLNDPAQVLAATSNYDQSIRTASPEVVEAGRTWYPKVHQAVQNSLEANPGFLSSHSNRHLAGSGLVAAVSPNMDWERNNIDAMGEMARMGSREWDAVMSGSHQDFKDVMAGTSIASASRDAMQRAGRIVQGEAVDDVLSPGGAPKTYNFAHNIHDPSADFITIDGRAFDTGINRALPWQQGRGISSSRVGNATGKDTRYDQLGDVLSAVSRQHGFLPSEGQAVSWVNTKDIENLGGTRAQGPARLGQPYFDPSTGAPVLHEGAADMRQKKTAAIRRFR